jgi:nucleotide-binding universal stress UspA family protein
MFKHLLITTDGSPLGNKAAKAGIALARALGAKVTAYNAIERLQMIFDEGYMMDPKMIDGFEASAREVGRRRVDAIGKMAKAAGVPFASVVANASTPYEGIINVAKKRKCDVIFMASHGRRGLSRLMMGSVTQKVLAHSKIPVVVYR